MPVVPIRISSPSAVSRRPWSALVVVAVFLLGLAAIAGPARALIVTGTCCDSTGACALTAESDCPTTGWWKQGSTCQPNPCPLGACCTPVGDCSIRPQFDCGEASTNWRSGGTCAPNPCVPTAACCAPNGACSLKTESACRAPNEWKEPGTSCAPANLCAPTGACCTPFRACTITTLAGCRPSDTWQGAATTCDPTPCPKPPTLIDYRFLLPDTLPDGELRPLTSEDTVTLLTRWEVRNSPQLRDSLTVTADFSRLDPGVPGNQAELARWLGDGRYEVTYPLSGLVSRRDSSGIRIPVSAAALSGQLTITDRRIEVCLSNGPPVHTGTRVVDPSDGPRNAPYRSRDSLVIETTWRSPDHLPLTITASFSQVDTLGAIARGSIHGEDTYLIRYRFPLSADQMPPNGTYTIPITARDTGCGQTTTDTIRVETDTEAPSVDLMQIDPLPAVTTADSVFVGGSAPGCVVILLMRDKLTQEIVACDPITGRFGGMLALLPGENKIQIRGEDAAGNSTLPYPTSNAAPIVTRVQTAQLDVGTPYTRKDDPLDTADDIVLKNPEPMDGATMRIFNLEGDCLWDQRTDQATRRFSFHWTGTDRAGDRAPQGYYLVRAEWREPGGKVRSLTKGLLLRD